MKYFDVLELLSWLPVQIQRPPCVPAEDSESLAACLQMRLALLSRQKLSVAPQGCTISKRSCRHALELVCGQKMAQMSGGRFGLPERVALPVAQSPSRAGSFRGWRNHPLPEQQKNSTCQ